MASNQLPVQVHGLLDLTSLGLSSSCFRFGSLTLESEKYICIRDEGQDGSPQVVVIELQNNNNVTRRSMKAEAAIMNPIHNIIALKAKNESSGGHFVQVYNLESRQKLKTHDFPEQIFYWRWLTPAKLAVVTSNSVYHWPMEGPDGPRKIFDRSPPLDGPNAQIINYTTDDVEKWCLLTAISTPDGGKTINGHMQLYYTEGGVQQILEGHAGCFGELPLADGGRPVTAFSFVEKKASEGVSRIHLMEINKPVSGQKFKATNELVYPQEAPNDFPVAMHMLPGFGVISMITKFGYLYLFEGTSAHLIYRTRLCEDTIFVTARSTSKDTVLGVNRRGQVVGISVNAGNIVGFIMNVCRHIPDAASVGFRLAQRFSLPGADELFAQQFNRLLSSGDIRGAARVAAAAPGQALRNAETIARLRTLPQQPGQPHPMMLYFGTILETDKLNKLEAIEITRPLLQQGRKNIFENWLQEDKIECSEELAKLVGEFDQHLALMVNQKLNNSQGVLFGLIATNQFDKVRDYCVKNNISPDYMSLIRQLAMTNAEAAVALAKQAGRNVDINAVADLFLGMNNVQAATSYLLKALEEDLPDQGHLQTKLLEINIMHAPAVAETIFQTDMFSHYDKVKIAQLCEQAGLYNRAIENYRDINDIRRVLVYAPKIPQEFLLAFFGHMTPANALQCLYDLLKNNRPANLQLVVQAAIKYYNEITVPALVKMFESFGSYDGLFYFLGAILSFSEDPDVHFKYIEAATKLNQLKEVERVVKDTKIYDPVRVKDFLKESKLPDPRALIYLCDMHGFTEELARYLYKNNFTKFIDVYLVNVNNHAAPVVLGTLLDLDSDEAYVRQVLNTLRAACPVEPLVEEMEKRNKLRVIQSWLEDRAREGSQDTALHTALAKIYIESNRDPEDFLLQNEFYDAKIVGKFCEDRNPDLAVKAYTRAWGECDDELIELTNKNAMYRVQARYLVERRSLDLWAKVLTEDNPHRGHVINQVTASALPDSRDSDEVSTAVKAFLKAELQKELLELLEKIVLHKSDFSKNKNLQNLLIVTAIKADPGRVVDYVNRLDNFDAPDIAEYALNQYGLAEEAFLIYRKAGLFAEAVDVLISNVGSLDRAAEFADKVGSQAVWSKLGAAQLQAGLTAQAIESYIRAEDVSDYQQLIRAADIAKCHKSLIRFLLLARSQQLHQRDGSIDSELLYAYAQCDMLSDMEEFMGMSNQADIGKVGERCFEAQLYEAAKILFHSVSNWARLASCLVKLTRFLEAIDAAKKANNPKVWKEVNFACVVHKEFKLATIAGLNIITHPDHLEDIIRHYEHYGHPEELISLLESGLASDKAHQGIYTELGVLYAKYRPKKLMEHCKNFSQKINIPMLIRACERYKRWAEAVYLYMKYDEYDFALTTMMLHSPKAWTHETFTSVISKVSNQDLYNRAIVFYLEEQPMLLNDLLKNISSKVDHAKAVQVLRTAGHLCLALPWLQSIQMYNVPQVNDAVNQTLLEQEDYDQLRDSVSNFDNFDQLGLAHELERHSVLEMRRIAALIYRNNQKYSQSLALSKKDNIYQDAMETAHESNSPEIALDLLKFFIEIKDKEAFCACTYVCYSVLSPDDVLELAWKANYYDFAVPYFVQTFKDINVRMQNIEKKMLVKERKEEEKNEAKSNAPLESVDAMSMIMPGFANAMPALMPSMPQTMNPMNMQTMTPQMQTVMQGMVDPRMMTGFQQPR